MRHLLCWYKYYPKIALICRYLNPIFSAKNSASSSVTSGSNDILSASLASSSIYPIVCKTLEGLERPREHNSPLVVKIPSSAKALIKSLAFMSANLQYTALSSVSAGSINVEKSSFRVSFKDAIKLFFMFKSTLKSYAQKASFRWA